MKRLLMIAVCFVMVGCSTSKIKEDKKKSGFSVEVHT